MKRTIILLLMLGMLLSLCACGGETGGTGTAHREKDKAMRRSSAWLFYTGCFVSQRRPSPLRLFLFHLAKTPAGLFVQFR